MKLNKYIMVLVALVGVFACRDESLYPLPYDDRTSGAYLRIYKVTSNVWDLDDLANSGFEGVFEAVDENGGSDLQEIEFYVTHRSGATGLITNEVFLKTIDASSFAPVPSPTYSEYLRSTPIRITANETIAALSTLTTDPDGTTCSGIFPDVCTMVAFPGTVALGDQIIYRWKIRLKDGRTFTTTNPQSTVTPAFGNQSEANLTPNVTGGQFFNAPSIYTQLVRRVTTTGNANAYTGQYRLSQVAIWSPSHSAALHETNYPAYMKEFLYGNSATDSSQIVDIQKVAGGLSSERQFTARYRGQTITVRINLEQAVINQAGAGLSAAAITTLTSTTGAAQGLGFPAGTTNNNLGIVFVPLFNTGQNCTSERQFYAQTPLAGTFTGNTNLQWGLPRTVFPNRGVYRFDQDGLTPGQTFSLSIDDDVNEYGRREGYCTFYRRVYLTLTKI